MNQVAEPVESAATEGPAWSPTHEPVHFYSDGLRLSGQFNCPFGQAAYRQGKPRPVQP